MSWLPSASSSLPLAATPGFSGSAYDLLTGLAEAEQAAHGFTEYGRYFYRSRSLWRDYTPVREITASNALTGLSVEESQDRAAATIEVPYHLPALQLEKVYDLNTAHQREVSFFLALAAAGASCCGHRGFGGSGGGGPW